MEKEREKEKQEQENEKDNQSEKRHERWSCSRAWQPQAGGEISTHTHIVSTTFSTIPNFGDLARGISTKNEFLCLCVLL